MEPLIFFLVVAFIIITNIVKAKKKFDKGASAPEKQPEAEAEAETGPDRKASSGWKRSMRDLLSELREEVSQQKAGQSPGPERQPGRSTGWGDLVRGQAPADQSELKKQSGAGGEKQPAGRRPERRQTLIESRSLQGWTPESRIGETTRRPPAPPLGHAAKMQAKPRRPHQYNSDELRRAVIWYEVLGPPMSLRDPEREMWL